MPDIATRSTGIGSLIILTTLWVMLGKVGLGKAVAVVTGIVVLYGTLAGMLAIASGPSGVSESTLLLASAFTLLVGGMLGAIALYSGTQLVISQGATVSMIVGLAINLLVVPTSERSNIARTISQADELGFFTTSVLSLGLTSFCWHISTLVLANSDQHRLLKRIAVAWSSFGNTCFYKADLTGADFTGASLKGADFRETILDHVNWRGAIGLQWARWGENPLSDNRVVELLTQKLDGKTNYCGVNLSFMDLTGANLSSLNLAGADLTGANLRGANLEGTILRNVRAVGTDFTGIQLTGACIENWMIDASTKLQQVDCRFVFLRECPRPGMTDSDRQPASGEFEPGDFTRLYQTVIDTFNLIFRDGINWKTFQSALEEVKQANPDANLNMQSVETKGDGYVVVKLAVESGEDKTQLYQQLKRTYAEGLSALEGRYQQLLEDQQSRLESQTQSLATIAEQLSQGLPQPSTPTGQSAIITFPAGSLEEGFTVFVQVWDTDGNLMQTQVGSLPRNPVLAEAYRRWQTLYYAQQPLFYDGFDVDVPTNFSLTELDSAAQQVLKQVNDWLKTPTFLPIDQCLRATFDAHRKATCVWQVDDISFQQLPLHCWQFFDDYPNVALTFSFLNTQSIAKPQLDRRKRRVLSVLGMPSDLNLDADQKILESMENVEVFFLVEPTVRELHEALWDKEGWDIFCFSGHSAFQGNRIWINEQESLSLEEMRYALREATQRGLSLAIFNCCRGLHLARQLASVVSTDVLVMREPVPDEAAQIFLRYLLASLQDETIRAYALKRASEQLEGIEREFAWITWLPIYFCSRMSA